MSDYDRWQRIQVWRVRFSDWHLRMGRWLLYHLPAWLVAFIVWGNKEK